MSSELASETKWPEWPWADQETADALREVLFSGRWAISGNSLGQPTFEQKFSEAFAVYNGISYCVPCANGSAGLVIALSALGVGSGDEVLVPALNWVACATSVLRVGAKPVFVDINEADLCIDLNHTRHRINKKTKAILLVHAYCNLADIDGFLQLSREQNIPIIEDCSQAHGAQFRGKRVGTFGKLGVFSFQQTKVLTSGEGGAVITDDAALASKVQQYRADGRQYHGYELVEKGDVQGYNFCISEFQCAVLLKGLAKLDKQHEIRRKNAEYLNQKLAKLSQLKTFYKCDEEREPVIYDYCIQLANNDENTTDFISAISNAINAKVFPIHPVINQCKLYQPALVRSIPEAQKATIIMDPEQFRNAEYLANQVIRLPHYLFLGNQTHMDAISKALENEVNK